MSKLISKDISSVSIILSPSINLKLHLIFYISSYFSFVNKENYLFYSFLRKYFNSLFYIFLNAIQIHNSANLFLNNISFIYTLFFLKNFILIKNG
jgi:hypothetical protein